MQVDDDAWLYVDGNLVNEDHYGYSGDTTTDFSAGVHSIDLFFDDRFTVYDQFVLTSSVTLSPVPEPAPIALLTAGAFGLLLCEWRRRKQLVG